MLKRRSKVMRIAREFRQELSALSRERLMGVYLFGSYARVESPKVRRRISPE